MASARPILANSKIVEVFNALVSESFANTIEFIAFAYATTKVHVYLLTLNSYMQFREEIVQQVNYLIDLYGIVPVFKIIFISYILSNLRFNSIQQKNFSTLVSLIFLGQKITSNNKSIIKNIFNFAFKLSWRFRDETALVYFNLLGLSEEFESFNQFNIFQNVSYLEYAIALADLASISVCKKLQENS